MFTIEMQQFFYRSFFALLALCLICSCSIKPVRKAKGIIYSKNTGQKLDVYSPRKNTSPKEVIVFIHGGSWKSGKRSLYRFFGKGMARKGAVGVVIDYRLSPDAKYQGMAMDAAEAVNWVRYHISDYTGDSSKIFVAGHSAGAHLGSLIALDPFYFDSLHVSDPIKGCILIDPFGLDMFKFFTEAKTVNPVYYDVFSKDSVAWKKGSPSNYLSKVMPPFLMFLGTKTYPAIKIGTTDFYTRVLKFKPKAKLIDVKRKKHVGMIFSYINPRNKGYSYILEFMHENS